MKHLWLLALHSVPFPAARIIEQIEGLSGGMLSPKVTIKSLLRSHRKVLHIFDVNCERNSAMQCPKSVDKLAQMERK